MRSEQSSSSSRFISEEDAGNRDAEIDSAGFDASLWAEAEVEANAWRTRHEMSERYSHKAGPTKDMPQEKIAASSNAAVSSSAFPHTGCRKLMASDANIAVREGGTYSSKRDTYGNSTYGGRSRTSTKASSMSILSMTQGGLPAFRGTATLYNKASSKPAPTGSVATKGIWEKRGFSSQPRFEVAAETVEEKRPAPLTVSETIERLRCALEGIVDGLWISGEVATVTRSMAGHLYFSLKDENGLIDCVYYCQRGSYQNQREGRTSPEREFRVGDRIEIKGRADIYAPRGRLQLIITSWQPAGSGELYEAFLKLRAKLELEGLFLYERKKPLPRFIRRVAVVTSAKAAAYRDVMRTIERRTPWIKVFFAEALVQGREAPKAIIAALRAADRARCDAILLVRGGGAYEDLQAFNDEQVARTLAAMRTPVICGIGHESDVTIADLVADLRASTPTAAAEALGQDRIHWVKRFDGFEETLEKSFERYLLHAMQRVDFVSVALPSPLQKVEAFQRHLTLMEERFADTGFVLAVPTRRFKQVERLFATPEAFIAGPLQRLNLAAKRLGVPEALLATYWRREEVATKHFCATAVFNEERRATRLSMPQERLETVPRQRLAILAQRLDRTSGFVKPPESILMSLERRIELAAAALVLADPDRPLRAGFARVVHQGVTVSGVSPLTEGDCVTLVFADGRAEATLERVEKK